MARSSSVSSTSRSRSRDRSRSRSRGRLSRSVSGELFERGATPPLSVEQVPKIIKAQQDFLVDLIAEHKQEVAGKLQARKRRFASRALERQFEVNEGFKELNRRALGALKRNNKAKAKKLLKELRDGLQEHEEDLLIADTSPNGWLAVAKVRGRSDIPEDLRKKLEKVDRELWRHRSYGKPAKKFGGFQEEGGGGDVRTRRPQQKLSPEEILHNAARQTRAGTCSHCRGENHFYRECPDFWKKVREAREERAKGQPLAN